MLFLLWVHSQLQQRKRMPYPMSIRLIGTQKSAIGYGGTMPFVTPPFGMTNWTPQTRQNKISVVSYNYDDHDYLGLYRNSPAGDLDGRLRLCDDHAAGGDAANDAGVAQACLQPYIETARPDYYRVSLDAGDGWKRFGRR